MRTEYFVKKPLLFFILLITNQLKSQPISVGVGAPYVKVMINKDIKITGGEVSNLELNKKIHVSYDYSRMAVGSFQNEAEYLENKKKVLKPKKYDRFILNWTEMRKNALENRFEFSLNEFLYPIGMEFLHDSVTNGVNLIVEPLKIEPDYRQLENQSEPYVKMVCSFFDKHGELMLRYVLTAYGSREKNEAERLGECYSIAGKMLAKDILKK